MVLAFGTACWFSIASILNRNNLKCFNSNILKQYTIICNFVITKKRKATIPVGGANKMVIESATTSPRESRENTDDEMPTDSENRQDEWESLLSRNVVHT